MMTDIEVNETAWGLLFQCVDTAMQYMAGLSASLDRTCLLKDYAVPVGLTDRKMRWCRLVAVLHPIQEFIYIFLYHKLTAANW